MSGFGKSDIDFSYVFLLIENGSGRKTAGKTPERKTEKEDAGLDDERRQ